MSTSTSRILRLLSALGRPNPEEPSGVGYASPPPGWHGPWPPWIIYGSTTDAIPSPTRLDELSASVPPLDRSSTTVTKAQITASDPGSVMRGTPDPIPPRVAVDIISTASVFFAIGAELPDEQLRKYICTGAQGFIQRFIDDYCGTPPGKPRGPRSFPTIVATAVQLHELAEAMSDGNYRVALLEAAEAILANGMRAVEEHLE